MDGQKKYPLYSTGHRPSGAAAQKVKQSPKGICFTKVYYYCWILVIFVVAGQRPRLGTMSCRMGRNSGRPSVRPTAS